MVGTIIAVALITFVVLLMVGAWKNGTNQAEANQYLADRYRDEKRRDRR
jgi:hypothetical protein